MQRAGQRAALIWPGSKIGKARLRQTPAWGGVITDDRLRPGQNPRGFLQIKPQTALLTIKAILDDCRQFQRRAGVRNFGIHAACVGLACVAFQGRVRLALLFKNIASFFRKELDHG